MDIERAKTALKNAHESGDVEAAKQIANALKSSTQGDAGGAGRAAAYGLVGGQVPFGNVITSGIGAGMAKAASPFTGDQRTVRELYDQAQADTKATQEANPGATLTGNVAGIASTIPLAFTKALSGVTATQGLRGTVNAIPQGLAKIDNFVRGGKAAKDAGMLAKAGSLALRSAKGAVVAAPTAGLYAAGDADAGQRGEAFVSGARLGAGVGAALPVAGAVLGGATGLGADIYKGFKSRDVAALKEAGTAIKENSSKAYKLMRDSGATFKPGATNLVIEQMQKQLTQDGILNSKLHRKTIDLFDDFKQEALDNNITLEGLDQWRQLFGQVAGEFGDKVNARKATILKNALDDAINELPEGAFSTGGPEALQALRLGRAEWAKQTKFNAISDIVEGAAGDANKLKRDLEKFRLNKKKTRGWTEQELNALKIAASQTTGEGILKLVGKFGFDLGSGRAVGNTALPIISGIMSGVGAGSGGIGLAVPAIGTAARVGQKMVASGKADDLLKVIEAGGNVTMDAINALPPNEQTKLLNRVMQMSPAKSGLFSQTGSLAKTK